MKYFPSGSLFSYFVDKYFIASNRININIITIIFSPVHLAGLVPASILPIGTTVLTLSLRDSDTVRQRSNL